MTPPRTEPRSPACSAQVIALHMHNRFVKNYSYVVVDPATRLAVAVDPAWEMDEIDRALAETRASLCGILLTHAHFDHVDLAAPLSDRYECPIWMSDEEIAASGYDAERLIGIDGRWWTIGDMLIEPILTPGHTPGCVCYLIGSSLFTGDVLFAEGCGICPDMEAAYAMFDSLQILKRRVDPATRIFPGHSYGKPPGQALSQLLRDNIYLQFSTRESFAAFRLRSGQDTARMFTFS